MGNQLVELSKKLTELLKAKQLLDDILGHYDTYEEEFEFPKTEFTLRSRIREYLKFDDSE